MLDTILGFIAQIPFLGGYIVDAINMILGLFGGLLG